MGRKTKPVNTEALEKLDIYNHNGVNLSEHTTVELDDKDFLRIVCVLQSSKTGAVFVHGHRFRRTQYMHGMFDDNCNEVCWIQELDEDDCRPSEVQSMHTATATQVVKQRELYLANRSCPTLSRCEQSLTDETDPVQKEALRQNIENNAPLTCRMKYIRYFKNARARRKKAFYEEAVCFLLARECDEKSNSISSDDLRQLWRGSTERGGAQLGMEPGEKEFLRQEEISHAGRTCRNSLIIAGRKYEHRDIMTRGTVGDLFIRGEGPDAGYCKLSGIDDKCFAASTLKVKTIEEASETQTEKEMSSEGLHGGSIDGKSFHTEDSRPRKKTRLLQSPEMMEGDSDRRIPQKMEMRTKDSRRYTFGDCFCGVGGMSRGAVMAGLRVKWGFDYNDNACYTYALNFVNALVYHEQAYLFATLKANHKVDICHMSTPCQYFSIAHNRVGRNDEENLASFFAVGDLLRKTKCRVAVLEQVPGLVRRRRHEVYFHACVRQFAENGFSVRWRVLNCANFGLPQRRERLFMIASCPGEPLPPFPRPTHAAHPPEGSSLKPWVTINDAIANIPNGWANHHIGEFRSRYELPYDGNTMATCITTGGGERTLHPSGTRRFTHREMACLQRFPLGHKFGSMQVVKLIGNAVPPIVGEAILKQVVETLEETDAQAEWEEGAS